MPKGNFERSQEFSESRLFSDSLPEDRVEEGPQFPPSWPQGKGMQPIKVASSKLYHSTQYIWLYKDVWLC